MWIREVGKIDSKPRDKDWLCRLLVQLLPAQAGGG